MITYLCSNCGLAVQDDDDAGLLVDGMLFQCSKCAQGTVVLMIKLDDYLGLCDDAVQHLIGSVPHGDEEPLVGCYLCGEYKPVSRFGDVACLQCESSQAGRY